MNFGDGESAESNGQGEDKNIIDKILGEMKSEFNKTEKVACEDDDRQADETPMDSSLSNSISEDVNAKTEVSTNENDTKENEEELGKPRIILSFKKPNSESPVKPAKDTTKRTPRQKVNPDEKIAASGLKRSARRRSKDCNESVLQSAIARKEKSYNESNRPQRLSRQLKPTQKILENLALAKQEKKNKTKISDKPKIESDSFTDTDKVDDDRNHRKHKHKHHYNRHSKKLKKIKSDSGRDSDSDQSTPEETQHINFNRNDECEFRRPRRVSSSRSRDDSNTDVDEQNLQDSIISDENSSPSKNGSYSVQDELIASRLCLCTEKSLFYLTNNDQDVTYCGAVDNIGDKLVGCSRMVNTQETMLMRSSARVPYTILCEAHTNRLLRHNCCPTCGIFCTQGRFVECEAKHHYHRECQISVGNVECCPHCGASAPSHDVDITIQTAKRPVFLPEQKAQ